MKGQIIFDDLDDKHRSVDLTLQLLRIELQQFSQGMERILMNKLDGIENSIEVKISSKIETQHRLLKDDVVSLTNRLSEKVDENIIHLNAIAQTRELLIRQEMVSLATNLSGKVDEKINDLIDIAQTEQRFLTQEVVSLTTNLSKKVDEKNGDLHTIVQTIQPLLTQDLVSLTTNLSGKVDEKITDLININLTEQRFLRQEMVSLVTNLSKKVDEKIGDLHTIAQTIQPFLTQDLVSLTTNLSGKVDKKITDLINITLIEQRLLRQEMVSLATNLSRKVDEKIGDLDTIAQTIQPLLTQEMVSLITNLSGKVDEKITDLFNISLIEQRLLRQEMMSFATNLSGKVDEKFIDFINITLTEQQLLRQEMVSVASKVETLLNNSEINRLKERENVLDDIRNSSVYVYVTEQISSGEVIQIQLCNITYSDCNGILEKNPSLKGKNGVYNIRDSNKAKTVYCDMTTDNGGWTVVQRRLDGSIDFYRNWTEYKNGFGFANHEYWIGNDMLHRLTSLKPQEMRVDIERFNGEKAYAVYSCFSVGDEANNYILSVQGYSGNAGDSLNYHNNMAFTTRDQDDDRWSGGNCATDWGSAGWFNICFKANPNGQYIDSEKTNDPKYLVWYHWKNSWVSLKSMKLMIRPRA
uniref:Fibrinogen C-terminal domain-containing protein n=2 Tax=Magallana gigas TaxID=29159 RepID=A0A8W8KJ45_MAGGI